MFEIVPSNIVVSCLIRVKMRPCCPSYVVCSVVVLVNETHLTTKSYLDISIAESQRGRYICVTYLFIFFRLLPLKGPSSLTMTHPLRKKPLQHISSLLHR